MTAPQIDTRLPALPGFDKECRSLVYAMIEAGWTGRITSKRHWFGKSPDGKATITVPSKYGNNRGLANAEAQFTRWIREQAHFPDGTPVLEIPNYGDPVVDAIIREGIVRKTIEAVHKPAVQMRPWLARRNAKQGGGIRYESEAVIERTWPDGRVDYLCSVPDCGYENDKPRSVANHYGAAHTSKGETEPAGNGPLHVDPAYTEPASTRSYRPTQRLVDALKAVLDGVVGQDTEEAAVAILTWMNERPDIEHESRPLVPLTDGDILNRIRLLVGQPDQTEQIESLTGELIEARRQRDEANAHLVKVQRDLDGIKELMEGVGR
jgi:hypothetical protein